MEKIVEMKKRPFALVKAQKRGRAREVGAGRWGFDFFDLEMTLSISTHIT